MEAQESEAPATEDRVSEAQVLQARVLEERVSVEAAVSQVDHTRAGAAARESPARFKASLELFLVQGREAQAPAGVTAPAADRGTEPVRAPDRAKTKFTEF